MEGQLRGRKNDRQFTQAELQDIFAADMNIRHRVDIHFENGVPRPKGRQGKHVPLVVAVGWEYFLKGFKIAELKSI